METVGRTPILDAISRHIASERASFHVPGHHQGRNLPNAFANWLGQAAKLDVTELPGLDNLHHAEDCILLSQQLTAQFYGSDACFYSVNGASAGVMAAIDACVTATKRSRVICLGPCHISVWRGLVYADAKPVYFRTPWDVDKQSFSQPTGAQLHGVLADQEDVAAVVVTSPNYQGYAAKVSELASVAHAHGVPLIVDEAHGAHFGLHASFPKHSVALGADIVVQSPHKTLPCLTQAAWVHVTSTLVLPSLVRQSLLFLQTTSPSYLLLSSLDVAQGWLWTDGETAAHETVSLLSQYRTVTNPLEDPMRLWIPTGSERHSQALEKQFQAEGQYVEYADANGVLAIFGFNQPPYEYSRFFKVYDEWLKTVAKANECERRAWTDTAESIVHLDLTPRQVARSVRRRVALADAVGCFAAEPLAPYPPGVPLVYPGQLFTDELVEALMEATGQHISVLGIDDRGFVEVIDA